MIDSDSRCYFNIQLMTTAMLLSFLSVHSTIIERPVFKWLNKQSGKEKDLLRQKTSLKNEQSSLSMVDEFAKYSKIQRRINSIDSELKKLSGNRPTNSFFVKLCFTYGVKLFFVILLIFMSLYYRHTPVLYLGESVDLTPFTHLICYPNEKNHISFYFWVICCAAVARSIKNHVLNINFFK